MVFMRWCIGLLSCLLAASAEAADISVLSPETATTPAIVTISGDMIAGDEKTFTRTVLEIDNAVIAFKSNGGAVVAGLGIGKAIRLKQFATMVADGDMCASACAMAWLGGTRRLLGSRSKIGFHAAYTNDNGNLKESGMANALVGSYLNQLGLRESAIAYITQAAPDSIQWLTSDDARTLGIEVESLSPSESAGNSTAVPAPANQAEFKISTGVDLFGNDLQGMPLKNLKIAACEDSCSAHSSCQAFTYNSKSKTCFLKAGADLAVLYAPATSGVKNSFQADIKHSMLSIMQRTDVIGTEYKSIDDINMENCLRVCDSDESCRAFSYIPKKLQCWLKSDATGTKLKKGVVSGIK